MKMNKIAFGMMAAAAISLGGAGIASASPVAPAVQTPAPTAKVALPVVSGVKSLSKAEKANVSGEGLLTVNALNGANLLNNLNLLNIGSFNSWRSGGSNCGCGNS